MGEKRWREWGRKWGGGKEGEGENLKEAPCPAWNLMQGSVSWLRDHDLNGNEKPDAQPPAPPRGPYGGFFYLPSQSSYHFSPGHHHLMQLTDSDSWLMVPRSGNELSNELKRTKGSSFPLTRSVSPKHLPKGSHSLWVPGSWFSATLGHRWFPYSHFLPSSSHWTP